MVRDVHVTVLALKFQVVLRAGRQSRPPIASRAQAGLTGGPLAMGLATGEMVARFAAAAAVRDVDQDGDATESDFELGERPPGSS